MSKKSCTECRERPVYAPGRPRCFYCQLRHYQKLERSGGTTAVTAEAIAMSELSLTA